MAEKSSISQKENSSPFEKKYAVVEFSDGIAVVSTSWMSSEIGVDGTDVYSCWWPDRSSSKAVRKMTKEQAPIDKTTWDYRQSVRFLASCNNWERILEKESKAQDTSCLDAEEDEGVNKHQSRVPPQYQLSTSVEDDTEDDREKQVPKVSRVPAFPVHKQSQSSMKHIVSVRSTSNTFHAQVASASTTINSTGTNTGFEVTVIKLLTELSLEVKELRKRVDHNTLLLNDLCSQRTDAYLTLREDLVETDLEVVLPLSTVEDLKALELKLEDAEFAKKMVLKLGLLGGKDIPSTAKSILSNLLAPELALQYNLTGAKGKKEFQSLKINSVILQAVRQNSKAREATKDDIKSCIISYLYNARDSKGGRNKRRANAQMVNANWEVQAEETDDQDGEDYPQPMELNEWSGF